MELPTESFFIDFLPCSHFMHNLQQLRKVVTSKNQAPENMEQADFLPLINTAQHNVFSLSDDGGEAVSSRVFKASLWWLFPRQPPTSMILRARNSRVGYISPFFKKVKCFFITMYIKLSMFYLLTYVSLTYVKIGFFFLFAHIIDKLFKRKSCHFLIWYYLIIST